MCLPNQMQRNQQITQETILVKNEEKEVHFVTQHIHEEVQQENVFVTTQLDRYQNLFHKLEPLSHNANAANGVAQENNLSLKDRIRRSKKLSRDKEAYKALGKSESLLQMKDITSLEIFNSRYGLEKWKEEKVMNRL